MTKTFYIKEHHPQGEWFWKHLCIVLDNETLGIQSRLLDGAKMEYKIEGSFNNEPSIPVRPNNGAS